jgi:hypothetical protein
MHHDLFLHVIHVSGKCMRYQGTDGLSRGLLDSGVLTGTGMLQFIPLHLSAAKHEPTVTAWVNSWCADAPFTWLTPFEWFNQGHQPGRYIWCPPPAAADAYLEQIAVAIHKRPQTHHIDIIPRLMTASWKKLFEKICDLVFTVPLGSFPWPHHHFELLLVGIYFPLSRHRPWRLRGTALLDDVACQLSKLQPSSINWGGDILRKLLSNTQSLESLSPSMARALLLK